MEISGTVKMVGETQTFGNNGFQKRELVVTTDEQYPQHILVEFVKDKCSLLDPIKEGQKIKVSINLRGREWTNPQGEVKYFNSIDGWRIEAETLSSSQQPKPEPSNSVPTATPQEAFDEPEDEDEEDLDLPF